MNGKWLPTLLIPALLCGCASGDNATVSVDVVKFSPSAPTFDAILDVEQADPTPINGE